MAGIAFKIETPDRAIAGLRNFYRTVGETDAPYLRGALERSGSAFTGEIRSRAVGGIRSKVQPLGVKGTGVGLRFAGKVTHPGARSMEFGRIYWKRNGVKRKHPPGQKARPYLGVKTGGAAIGAIRHHVEDEIFGAIEAEYARAVGRI